MKKTLKITGIIVALLLVILLALPFIYKNKIVEIIKTEANKNIKAKLDFGDIDLGLISSFPYFSLEIENLKITGVGNFENDTLTYTDRLYLKLNIMSVIKGDNFEINSVELYNPIIRAVVLKNGQTNWDITYPDTTAVTDTSKTTEPIKFKLSLKKVYIENADIKFSDDSLKFYMHCKGLTHSLKGDFTQDDFLLETMTEIKKLDVKYEGIKYISNVNTKIKADINANMPQFKFTFKENKINMNELEVGVDGYFAMPDTSMEMNLTFYSKQTDFKNILSLIPAIYYKDFSDVKTSGKFALNGELKGKYNAVEMPAFKFNLKVNNAMFRYPSLPMGIDNINIDLKLVNPDGVPDNTLINLSLCHFEVEKDPFDIKLITSDPIKDPKIDFEFVGQLNLDNIQKIVPLEKDMKLSGNLITDLKAKGRLAAIEQNNFEDFNASGNLKLTNFNYISNDIPLKTIINDMELNFNPKNVTLKNLDMFVGRSDFKMNGTLDNVLAYYFNGDMLTGILNLNSDYININEFSSSTSEATTAESSDTSSLEIINIPNNINFTLKTKINKLIYDNLDIDNVNGGLHIYEQKVEMKNLSMNLLDGNLIMDGAYSTPEIKKAKVNFMLKINNFDIKKSFVTFNTVQKLAPIAENASGKFSSELTLNTDLNEKMEPIYQSMNGAGRLTTKTVVIENVKSINKLADAIKYDKLKKMELNNINISFSFAEGKINVEPFDIKLGNFKSTIQGFTSFDQSIDYVMNIEVPRKELGGVANNLIDNLSSQAGAKGVDVKIGDMIKLNALIGGTISNPTVKTSLKDAKNKIKDEIKDKVKDEINKKKQELEDKAKAETDKLKAEADKKKQELEAKAKAEAAKAKAEAEAKLKAEAEKAKKEAENKIKEEAKKKLKKLF